MDSVADKLWERSDSFKFEGIFYGFVFLCWMLVILYDHYDFYIFM